MTRVYDDVPSEDHVVRYVRPTLIKENRTIDGLAFVLRENQLNEKGLSVHWLESLGTDRTYQLREIRRLNRLRRSKNGCFAELNVGEVLKKLMSSLSSTARFVKDPLEEEGDREADPSHAQLIGLPKYESSDAIRIGYLISECVLYMHPAVD